jgi:hypothetical protein
MSINLGTYALVSALAVGGAVAQYQYSEPAGPPDPNTTEQSQAAPGYPSSPTGTGTGAVDCNTLMTTHQQMMQELDGMDQELDTRVSQMRDAQSDKAKLDATAGVVELLVTQRKQIRDRMMTMEHQTLHLMLTNKPEDLATSCPQLTEQLQHGSMHGQPTMPSTTEPGGPTDIQPGNEREQDRDNTTRPNDNNQNR